MADTACASISSPLSTKERCVTDSTAKDAPDVTVCICTFRRPSILKTIDSILTQSSYGFPSVILVIDNDDHPSAKDIVTARAMAARVKVQYVHAPARNISIARNAALDSAKTRWLAFIDDDEYASADWLTILWCKRQGAHAIFGPTRAVYPGNAPQWIKDGDYHSNLVGDRRPIDTGYTSNVLIDLEFVRTNSLRFDPLLGTTGGEDTIFFHDMFERGAFLKYTPDAVAYEEVTSRRLTFRWIAKRRFRVGQVYAMMFYRSDLWAYRAVIWSAPLKITTCLIMTLLMIWRPSSSLWWLMRSLFHGGVLSFGLGIKMVEEYRVPLLRNESCQSDGAKRP
jgi:succinoglycan biosynthesis protein ExoM